MNLVRLILFTTFMTVTFALMVVSFIVRVELSPVPTDYVELYKSLSWWELVCVMLVTILSGWSIYRLARALKI